MSSSRITLIGLALLLVFALTIPVFAGTGSIKGSAFTTCSYKKEYCGEHEVRVNIAGSSTNSPLHGGGWTTSYDGTYSIPSDGGPNLDPGTYAMGMSSPFEMRTRNYSYVKIFDNQTTYCDIINPGTYEIRNQNGSTPTCARVGQTFVSKGGSIERLTFWYTGNFPCKVTFYAGTPETTLTQVGNTRTVYNNNTIAWNYGDIPTIAGQTYYVELEEGAVGRGVYTLYDQYKSDYTSGHAYYNRSQQNVVLMMTIFEDCDGQATFYKVLHSQNADYTELWPNFSAAEGGQTFVAKGSNVLHVDFRVRTGSETPRQGVLCSIHSGGPGGAQIGPTKAATIDDNMLGSQLTWNWLPGEVPVTNGNTYYVKVTHPSGVYFWSSQQSIYQYGSSYMNGVAQNGDLEGTIMGEVTLGSSTYTISGTVRNSAGRAVEGAFVKVNKVSKHDDLSYFAFGYSATTDASGNYSFKVTSMDTYTLKCMKSGITVDGPTVNATNGGSTTWSPTISGIGDVSGYIRNISSNPLLGSANINNTTGGTDVTGYYTIKDIPVGTYSASGYAYCHVPQTKTGIVVTNGGNTPCDFSLTPRGYIYGYVKDAAGNPISGANVSTNDGNTQSQANGYYEIMCLVAGAYSVTAAKTSYQPQTKTGIIVTDNLGTQVPNFNLTLITALANPGFEASDGDNPPTGWTAYGNGLYARTGSTYPNITAHSGTRYARAEASWTDPKSGGIYQRIWTPIGCPYTVSVWVACYGEGGGAANTMSKLGVDPTGGTNQYSGNVQWTPWYKSPSDGVWAWTQLSATVTATTNFMTIFLHYYQQPKPEGGAYSWQVNVFDDVAMVGPAILTIANAKQVANDTYLIISPGIITAKFAGPDCFYVEDPSKIPGIKIASATGYVVGDKISVGGKIQTALGERYINPAVIDLMQSSFGCPKSLMMMNSVVGGDAKGLVPGIPDAMGANNIGLLVTVSGIVSGGSGNYFYLCDGSGKMQEDGTLQPIKVLAPTDTTLPEDGKYAVVTGISSTEDIGGGVIGRLLRARSNGIISY